MPKFWAKDYLSEALQRQRTILEHMLLAIPHHIEVVECYAHRGEVEDEQYAMPWILATPESDPTLQTQPPFPPLSTTMTIVQQGGGGEGGGEGGGGKTEGQENGALLNRVRVDLQTLVSGGRQGGAALKAVERLEEYGGTGPSSESLFSDDDGDAAVTGTSLSQEIDSAMERVMCSWTDHSDGGCGQPSTGMHCGEEFVPENMMSWELNVAPDMAEYCLEDHVSPCHLPSLLAALPTVADLSSRLKPKLISDPLLSNSGHFHSYRNVCSSDFTYEVEDSTESDPLTTEHLRDFPSVQSGDFPRETIQFADDGVEDPVLELHIASPPEPLIHSSTSPSLLPPLPPMPSPDTGEGSGDLDHKTLERKSSEDLCKLASEAGKTALKLDQKPQFSPAGSEKTGQVDFVKLNNTDVSHDSDDSGIGHALLESPCLSQPLTSSPHVSLSRQLSKLEPLPVTPDMPTKLVLLSPNSEERLKEKQWEESRSFDNILALKLPYVQHTGNLLEEVMKSYNTVNQAVQCFNIHTIYLSGDSELALPWDPLAESYQTMAAAQRSVVCLQCPLEVDGSGTGGAESPGREHFQKDAVVKVLGGYLAQSPISMVQEGDLPSLNAAPQGYHRPISQSPRTKGTTETSKPDRGKHAGVIGGRGSKGKIQFNFEECASPLDLFVMLRTSLSPGRRRQMEAGEETSEGENRKADKPEGPGVSEDSDQGKPSCVTSPTVIDVYLTREYQALLGKVSHYGLPLMDSLQAHGLNVPYGFSYLEPDDAKFFLKQQQKLFADSHGSDAQEAVFQSCKLAACLYVLVSLADAVANISLTTGFRKFSSLNEKYEDLIGSSLDLVKGVLADIQLKSKQQNLTHPKLQELIQSVITWRATFRKHRREKAVVVVGREFSTVSGDILDVLQSIPDLQSCVFSFLCESPNDPLYLEAVEERFYHYDCLVIPVSSITTTFPWEKVSLLVEYEPLGGSLFTEGCPPSNLRLRQWVALKTAREISASALARAGSDVQSSSVLSFQYTLIASENVTRNPKILQLLESRFNITLISRDYERLRRKSQTGPPVAYADLVVDQSTGIIVQPLSLLASDSGVHSLSTRVTALSLQYKRLWVVLHAEAENSYPYGGSVPLNLARLHASVAHYSPQQDAYEVKVMCASGCEEAAYLVRNITDETHRQSEVVSELEWNDREWIADDFDVHEAFLLNFPCLNSYAAQWMLRSCKLGQLLALDWPQLQKLFPQFPLKVLKFFYRMCHVSFRQEPPVTAVSEYWDGVGNAQLQTEEPASLDDSLQYLSDGGDSLYSRGQDTIGEFVNNSNQIEETVVFPGEPIAMSSEDDAELMMATPYPHPYQDYNHPMNDHVASTENGDIMTEADTCVSPSMGGKTDVPIGSMADAPMLTVHGGGHWSEGGVCEEPPHTIMSFSLGQSQPRAATTTAPTSCAMTSFSSTQLEESGPLRVPSQKQKRAAMAPRPPGAQLGSGTTSSAQSIARDYYGGQILPNRLVTSGMVRRTPNRQPIKSLDLGFTGSTNTELQPHLQANDRAAAVHYDTGTEGGRNQMQPMLVPNSARGCTNGTRMGRIQGLSGLMDFHSQQSLSAPNMGRNRPFLTSGVSSTVHPHDTRVPRHKRPLPPSPIFEFHVPSNTPPQDGRESTSSLYSSPVTSVGSVKLSPVRKKRLVCKEVLSSSRDGQTKLFFE